MTEKKSGFRVLVVLASHDKPTRTVTKACEGIERWLDGLGYTVERIAGEQATTARVHELMRRRQVEGSPFRAAFIVAHGSRRGVYNKVPGDSGSKIILQASSCSLFKSATLVVCSCLKTGEFPSEAVQRSFVDGGTAVGAVIGYAPKLQIFPSESKWRWLTRIQKEVLSQIMAAHAAGLREGVTADEAIEMVRRTWRNNARKIPVKDREFRLMWLENVYRLQSWGDGEHSV